MLCDGQLGFRPKHSNCTAVVDVANHITLSMNSKLLTLALLIDISKAFNSIYHKFYFTNYNTTVFVIQLFLVSKLLKF